MLIPFPSFCEQRGSEHCEQVPVEEDVEPFGRIS